MKTNPIMIIKQDSIKKRNTPIDLKRKIGSLPVDVPKDHYLTKIESKPRSTSKSADKPINLNFSKNYLAGSKINVRSNSGDRMKSASIKSKLLNTPQGQIPLIKIDKSLSHHTSKNSHYHSADRDLRKTKAGSNNKSYLIDYLNQKQHSTKA